MKDPGLTINLPVRDSERERVCERARAAGAQAEAGGGGWGGGEGREELRRKNAITEVQEM